MRIGKSLAGGIVAAQLGALLTLLAPGNATAATEIAGCAIREKSTVTSGYGMLENLAFDGRGGLLLSELPPLGGNGGGLQRLTADGARSTVAALESPGGIVVSGRTAFVNTGNTFKSGVTDSPDGTVAAVDLDSGAISTMVGGLSMPNGLAVLPDGSFVVSRDLGPSTALTRIAADGSGAHTLAPDLAFTNGLAYDPARRKLFVSTTFDATTTIAAIDIDHPEAAPARVTIPGFGPLNSADDMTVGPDGAIYVALNTAGQVARVDTDAGTSCIVADGLPFITSVRFGAGPGWDSNSLYATGFLGTVTRLAP